MGASSVRERSRDRGYGSGSTEARTAAAPIGGEGDNPIGGELNAAIARAVVRVHRRCVGRGPTKAQAFFRHEFVVVVLRDVLTPQEHTLLDAGQRDAVQHGRRGLQAVMQTPLAQAVEQLTAAHVLACLSATHLDPDMSATLFMLDRDVGCYGSNQDAQAPPSPGQRARGAPPTWR